MKKRTINYLIVEKKLNNDILLDKDIITKITLIKDYYKGVLPKHISLFVEEIEKMPTYKALQKIKGSHDEDHVKDVYLTFINDYFLRRTSITHAFYYHRQYEKLSLKSISVYSV